MAETVAIVGSVLAAVSTVAGAGLQIAQAQQQAGMQRIQAQQAAMQAQQGALAAEAEEQRGAAAALDTRENLLRTLAAQNARYAAAGIVLEDGTVGTVQDASARTAERELQLIRTGTTLAAEGRRFGAGGELARATALRDQASFTSAAGYAGAGISLARGGLQLLDRQPGTVNRPPQVKRPGGKG